MSEFVVGQIVEYQVSDGSSVRTEEGHYVGMRGMLVLVQPLGTTGELYRMLVPDCSPAVPRPGDTVRVAAIHSASRLGCEGVAVGQERELRAFRPAAAGWFQVGFLTPSHPRGEGYVGCCKVTLIRRAAASAPEAKKWEPQVGERCQGEHASGVHWEGSFVDFSGDEARLRVESTVCRVSRKSLRPADPAPRRFYGSMPSELREERAMSAKHGDAFDRLAAMKRATTKRMQAAEMLNRPATPRHPSDWDVSETEELRVT